MFIQYYDAANLFTMCKHLFFIVKYVWFDYYFAYVWFDYYFARLQVETGQGWLKSEPDC